MKMLSTLAAVFYLCGCSPDHEHSPAGTHSATKPAEEHPHEESDGHGPDETPASPQETSWFTVNEDSQKLLGMTFEKTEMRSLEGLIRLQGRLRPAPSSVRGVCSPVSGIIRLLVLPGAEVKSGAPLFTVDAPELGQLSVRREKLDVAAARLTAEVLVLARRLEVHRASGTRNAELEAALATKEAEQKTLLLEQKMFAVEESLIARMGLLNGSQLTVTAQASGIVQLEKTIEGSWCEKGAEILRVQSGRAFICEARATAHQAENVTNGLPVTLTRIGKKSVRGLSLIRGSEFDERTLTCALYASVTNPPAWFYSGLPVTMEIQTSVGELHTAVPANAIFLENGKSMAFVRHAQDPAKFARREVEVHTTVDGYSSVCGVTEGESVVLEGAYELRYQFPVGSAADTVKKAGHFHADGVYHEGEHK